MEFRWLKDIKKKLYRLLVKFFTNKLLFVNSTIKARFYKMLKHRFVCQKHKNAFWSFKQNPKKKFHLKIETLIFLYQLRVLLEHICLFLAEIFI
jgi:hypothetical protein